MSNRKGSVVATDKFGKRQDRVRAFAKGRRFENDVVNYLREVGFSLATRCRKIRQGDVDGIPTWHLEVRDHSAHNIAGWVDRAKTQAADRGTPWWACIVKRRYKPISQAYFICDLDLAVHLINLALKHSDVDPALDISASTLLSASSFDSEYPEQMEDSAEFVLDVLLKDQ